MRRSPNSPFAQATLLSVIFIDLVGFGILAPLAPFYVQRTGLGAEHITLVLASYSLMQFLATPVWGHLSDRFGRRPVLLVSMAGHVGTYLLLAFAETWEMLLLARLVGGLTAANLAAAYAYVADTTEPKDRAAALGRISAAFGLGFTLGPLIGGFLAGAGAPSEANLAAPAFFAAGLSACSFLAILFLLPESRRAQDTPAAPASGGFFAMLGALGHRPALAGLLAVCVIVIAFIAMRETVLPLWAADHLGLGVAEIGIVTATSGGVIALFQALAIGPLVRRFGEANLTRVALVALACGWGGIVAAQTMWGLMAASIFTAIGTALFQTCLQTLISSQAGAHERGLALGAYQSASALARFGGQASSGGIYAFVHPTAPFLIGIAALAPALLMFHAVTRRLVAPTKPADAATIEAPQ
jgi:DHA1 family tetracycline resistance protein-like MFS transporter